MDNIRKVERDLTTGNISAGLWAFAFPLMIGNVMQQFYNLVDTWVVGKYIGDNALAAVGSSYTLMTFLTSIIIGLCLGSSAFISMAYGKRDLPAIRNGIAMSFGFIGIVTVVLIGIVYGGLHQIIKLLLVPSGIVNDMTCYLWYVCLGIVATFLYNFCSNVLRGMGNSVIPLLFLGVAVVLNVGLDLMFVLNFGMGIKGAAIATVIAQYVSGLGISGYLLMAYPELRIHREDLRWNGKRLKTILSLSGFTCLQQSVMNLGILMVQGIVNSFGTTVIAAFAVAVKIDTIAYMPVQDFGNAFSVFVAQNYGAGKQERIRKGIRQAGVSVVLFCAVISTIVFMASKSLMGIFVDQSSVEVIRIGAQYLQIEGAFYIGIGILFMLYGYYRAVNQPAMSVVLTVISLGTRVALAYGLSGISSIGVVGIWAAIPIGWFLADLVGIVCYRHKRMEKVTSNK